MNLEQNITSKEHLQPALSQAVIRIPLTRTVHTVCVHVPIVHMLIIREELHKASRLHLRVHTWRGTGECATGREERQRRTNTHRCDITLAYASENQCLSGRESDKCSLVPSSAILEDSVSFILIHLAYLQF